MLQGARHLRPLTQSYRGRIQGRTARVELNDCYLIAGSRPWNRSIYEDTLARRPGRWHFIGSRAELTAERVAAISPRYLFFLHWSWKVPPDIVDRYECVLFHMTDVPYGRGGSPLQNLIQRGHTSTRLSAIRMVHELDAGPVYLKEPLSLDGSAQEIYIRQTRLSCKMIELIIEGGLTPTAQTGDPVIFERRTPEQSALPAAPSLQALYDFIRMLDCDGYPRAFLTHGGYRFEFSRSTLRDGSIHADVAISRTPQPTPGPGHGQTRSH